MAVLAAINSKFGPEGLTLCVGQAALSILMLEAANYVQHYGLQRHKLANGRCKTPQLKIGALCACIVLIIASKDGHMVLSSHF